MQFHHVKRLVKQWGVPDSCFSNTSITSQTAKIHPNTRQIFFSIIPPLWIVPLILPLNVPTLNAEDYIIHSRRQNPRFFWPSKPWHKIHLNALPPVLHSSGMTNLSTVWQVWSCMLHGRFLLPLRKSKREPGMIRYSSLAGWSRRPCDK